MYGAILGDIIGSPFEFDRGDKTKEFDLFSKGCDFTDDSVMTVAVGEALLAVEPEATVKEIEEAVVTNMQDWGKRYPHAGYGGRVQAEKRLCGAAAQCHRRDYMSGCKGRVLCISGCAALSR